MRLILYGGIFISLLSFILLPTTFKNMKIEKYGEFVKMRIERLPNSCLGTKAKHYAALSYNGMRFVKRIPAGYCNDHRVGEWVEMKYLEGETEIFFPRESQTEELIAGILILFLGIGCIVYYLVKY